MARTHAAALEVGLAAACDPVTCGPTNPTPEQAVVAARVAEHNRKVAASYAEDVPWDHPVGRVFWIHLEHVQANDWNPNAVAASEMGLLHTSISEDGYTMPIVTIWDPTAGLDGGGRFVIVDGFHRFTTMGRYPDIYATTGGYLPLTVLEKSVSDRMASTVRHNRARGKHSVAGMSNLVFEMLKEGMTDVQICQKMGLEAEELARLKHITGYSKLFAGAEYGKVMLTSGQLEEKVKYKQQHPDEVVPRF